jgi:hypothetical protein
MLAQHQLNARMHADHVNNNNNHAGITVHNVTVAPAHTAHKVRMAHSSEHLIDTRMNTYALF